ncbi:MAG: lamin tail domain-containing protein, partial [Nanoarchaeota archaeon]
MKILIYLILILLISFNVNALTVINEFMYNPEGNDNNKEFIEIYSEDYQNLSNFIIEDISSEDILQLVYYYNSNYSLIVEDDFNYSDINASIYVVGATIGNNLNNDKDVIIFRENNRKIIDLVAYSSDFGGDEKSLERIFFNSLSSEKSSWIETTSQGTPGRENFIVKDYSALKINEFLPDPIGQDDASMPTGEFIELYNSGDNDLDLSGLYFLDEANHKLIIDNTHATTTIIQGNSFLVIYVNGFSGLLNNDRDKIKLYYSNLLID